VLLDAYLFYTISQAQEKADTWSFDYNIYHPHKSLGGRKPRELWDDFVNNGKLSQFTTINKDDIIDKSKILLNLKLS